MLISTNAFVGTPRGGDWTLRIADEVGYREGRVLRWGFAFEEPPARDAELPDGGAVSGLDAGTPADSGL